jgi:hypothetical protein
MKNLPVGRNCSMRTDERADRHDEVNSRFFRNFSKAPKTLEIRGTDFPRPHYSLADDTHEVRSDE